MTVVITSPQGFAGLQTVQITEDQQEVSITLVTGRLAGRVLAATGEPVEEATVSLDALLPDASGTVTSPAARTGADGTFEISELGAGTYRITVRNPAKP